MDLVSSGFVSVNDSSHITYKQLIQQCLMWNTDDTHWHRKCPQCKTILNVVGKTKRRTIDQCYKSIIRGSVCKTCMGLNKQGKTLKPIPNDIWENEQKEWCRYCLFVILSFLIKVKIKQKLKISV